MSESADSDDPSNNTAKIVVTWPEESSHVHVLHITAGRRAGEFEIIKDRSVSIGRDDACDIQLSDLGVSRRHASVWLTPAGVALSDQDSRNGTWVNGKRIQSVLLSPGDRIQLGPVRLRYSVEEESEVERQRELLSAVTRDHLTGVYNRRYFEERLGAEVAYCIRHRAALALVAVDVDRFKSINDTFGHPVGDLALKSVAQAFEHATRAEDVIARVGGEEFMVLARGTGVDGALTLARRLLQRVRELRVSGPTREIRLTVSAGVAAFKEGAVSTAGALVRCADHALLEAKRSGRDRVCVSTWTPAGADNTATAEETGRALLGSLRGRDG